MSNTVFEKVNLFSAYSLQLLESANSPKSGLQPQDVPKRKHVLEFGMEDFYCVIFCCLSCIT